MSGVWSAVLAVRGVVVNGGRRVDQGRNRVARAFEGVESRERHVARKGVGSRRERLRRRKEIARRHQQGAF
jgi:hypothetical protein